MVSRTLVRYFGTRFLGAVMSVFLGIFVLIVLVDYIELMRRAAEVPNLSAWLVAKTSFFRVPQLPARLLPFSVLVGAMTCYLALSRRNELVVARSAGMSAWQFVAPALIVAFLMGIAATASRRAARTTGLARRVARTYQMRPMRGTTMLAMIGARSRTPRRE